MDADRSFPPSPRRLGLARRAGLHAASPLLVGAAACVTAALALAVTGRAIADRLGASIASAIQHAGHASPEPAAASIVGTVLELALPALGAVAVVALATHLAQTRAVWMPRRRVDNAPALPADAAARTRRAWWGQLSAIVIGVVAFAWLWLIAPRLAALPTVPLAAASLIAAALATIAIAWVALGVIDSLLRHAELGRALRMTAREKREDERRSAADPRWRELRRKLARGPRMRGQPRSLDAVAGATLLLLGDDIAVAIAWDPVRRRIPTRIATGRGVLATQLLGLARRHRTPVHREHALAAALVGSEGAVDETHWPRLAEIVAAVRR